ncbi:helicase domino isoform X2 [Eupeodes corollae]|uniref:helicase domino isoform X2 n=1 Tax=Eupeodes corollae TaxID=290404 RepID=UPI002491E26E|nr:helicase domino isoform X2 [Eupeodes corollae]
MNEGDSAGGGQQGHSPAPPAVPDRRSTIPTTTISIATLQTLSSPLSTSSSSSSLISLTSQKNSTIIDNNTTATSSSSSSFQQIFNQQLGIQNQQTTPTAATNSGSAVTSSLASNSNLSQYQQQLQQHMQTLRFAATASGNSSSNNNINQQQQHQRILQIQQQQQQQQATALNSSYNNNSAVSSNNPGARAGLPANNNVNLTPTPTGSSLATYSSSPTAQSPNQSPLSKRIKLELPDGSSAGSTSLPTIAVPSIPSDFNALKKRILEHKYSRIRSLKEKYSENVAELFYLQSGGNMMDYPTWRKKPPSPQFISFSNAYRLDQLVSEETKTLQNTQSQTIGQQGAASSATLPSLITPSTTSSQSTPVVSTAATSFPQGAEIKIPAVGATPVAVSTQLPAAVVQLTQQGGTPLVPSVSGNSSISEKRRSISNAGPASAIAPLPTTTPASAISTTVPSSAPSTSSVHATSSVAATSVTTTNGATNSSAATGAVGSSSHAQNSPAPPTTPNATSGNGSGQEFSFKAKQEVYVMQRITELQREGLWTEKRLPKLQEPSRPKAHWDYLLEEMVWLAADFAQERKWKKNAAKKCAKMVQKYFQDKANAAQKAEKAHELHLKRVAAFISKEVKMFWSNVEKLVEYKHHTKLEEKRKKALDQHLSFIVDQTEKFSQQLAVGMNKSVVETSANPSINSSRISSPKRETASDDEFRPSEEGSEDDEETIAKAEEEAADVNEEVAALEKESQMDLDDFLKGLPKDYLANRDKIVLEENKNEEAEDDEDDKEFQAHDEPSEDDENTISKQEAEEAGVDHKKELDELEADNEMSVEKLLEKYKSGKMGSTSKMELDSDDDEQSADSDDVETEESEDETMADETAESSASEENEQDGLKSLVEDHTENKDDIFKDAAALAESIQPKGNTLSSTNVVTPVPFLLKHSLREYQHIGLDWLVTMHDRKLNGILADEMGLGKTIQTIALLAHLACVKGNWGPHLIVVPSSVMLNWEMEFKKWCPGFKILTYYGAQKERKLKRVGWTKPNAFHVCITSYKLVVQDQQSFRRKKWKYLILDEAQNIKNFKSQRWQLLLNFSTERRLLLTGTPLQNDLMELWSLMHFLMPYVFQSHREFKEWFSNPMTGMIEGNCEYNETLISRLHKVIRPFLLRRLKKEVEKQMPKKYEHVVMCRLSNRQRYLYEDFMSRAKTRETLSTGNFLSVINVLMQLRKVCNHPNLFEVRPTISPFHMEGITYAAPHLTYGVMDYDPFTQIDLNSVNLMLINLEITLTAYVSHKVRLLAPQRKLIEEVDQLPEPPPRCPTGKYKFHIRIRDTNVQQSITTHSSNSGSVKVGTSPAMKTEGNKLVPVCNLENKLKKTNSINPTYPIKLLTSESVGNQPLAANTVVTSSASSGAVGSRMVNPLLRPVNGSATTTATGAPAGGATQIAKIVQMKGGKQHFVLTPGVGGSGHRITLVCKTGNNLVTTGNVISCGKPLTTAVSAVTTNNLVARSGAITATSGVSRMTTTMSMSAPTSISGAVDSGLVKALAQQVKTTAQSALVKSAAAAGLEKMEVDEEDGEENDPSFDMASIKQLLKERRQSRLNLMARINNRRCDATPIYGDDCRQTISNARQPIRKADFSTWQTSSFANCQTAMSRRDSWTLTKIIKSYVDRTQELLTMFNNFVIFVPPVSSPLPQLHVHHMHPSTVNADRVREQMIVQEMSPKLSLLHPIISAMNTQFPDPRLIQYDCGKLQTLDRLLRTLKSGQHRVLIFTQMTKMLDVLEAFLTHHGHIYLRLDGSTRVEQRQILMERFNGDKRIFVFILSTRSGGVGINLTGADTVIFYDSDWNPTMDAQAQDRCHRIGQTRDVHIYRLVSEKTIEVNILKKANQKRMLSDMAIEGGNFTTTFFKSTTIKDLFDLEPAEGSSSTSNEPQASSSSKHVTDGQSGGGAVMPIQTDKEKQSLRAFETALANVEDDLDVEATKIATAEADADLEEFDETIPLEETERQQPGPEMSRADLEVQNLVKQLSPIERYAMRFVEATGGAWTAEQLRAAEAEIEAQKREWEANRLAALQKEEEMLKAEAEADEVLTYSRKDAKNQIWISDNTMEQMPMWCPPTPPQNDNDIYIDHSLGFMYDTEVLTESHLPPVYVKKEYKRSRTEAGFLLDGRRPPKIRKDDNFIAPRSLFDRPSGAVAKIRRDLKLQRYRGIFKPNVQIPGLKPQTTTKSLVEPEGMVEWSIYEDIAIVHVLSNLQGLPINLMLLSPGHTPNWDLVAEIVNMYSKTYRSPKHCRWRYEAVIVPREEGKLLESPKKQKKMKSVMKACIKGGVKSLRTSQNFIADNNSSFSKLMKSKFDGIKTAFLKKAPPPKRHFSAPSPMNPKHAEVLKEFGIANYDNPLSPRNIAMLKANKMREKQRTTMQMPAQNRVAVAAPSQEIVSHSPQQAQQPQQQQQQQTQQIPQQIQVQQASGGQQTAIVLQQAQQQMPNVIQQQGGQIMQSRAVHQQTTQIVKTIVTPQSGLLHGQIQQLTQSGAQQIQLQQSGNMVTPSSVSVVLTTPVSTMSNVQHQGTQSAQIVSIQPQSIVSSASLVSSQSQMATLVQTLPSQSMPQVVSVSQLATVGTVLTTSANMQPNATVTTLNASALRAQRIVAAPGCLQDVVLQQRQNSQSPTIVSMNSLGQTVTQAQFQGAQLRLSMAGTQQVVTKGIPVSSLQQTGKLTNQPAQIQLYRQRQQLKVLQTPGQGGQVVQTAGGQTTLVNAAGTIIQGGVVQTGPTVQVQGQKVSVATVSAANVTPGGAPGVVTSVATVQVAHNQGRTQFIKQVGGKQTIARQVNDNEMLLVKRQVIAQPKTQVLQQGQILTPANVQIQQQPGTSGQQQIATLVKTSSGNMTTASPGGTINMALSHVKPGSQIKVTMANQSQMRQLHVQQHLAIAQPRKLSKMTQIAQGGQVGQKPGVQTQLVHIQNTKTLPGSMTVQQIQQVMRQGQQGTLSAAGLVLGKTSVGRVIPVSVASQANARQTIQVVSASSAQALTAGNIRAHVASGQNIAGTIKVAQGATQAQTQQALINAIQNQQGQRQNASPARLQTTAGGNLVAVTVQQSQGMQQQQVNVSSMSNMGGNVQGITTNASSVGQTTEVGSITITTQQQQNQSQNVQSVQQQQQQQQQQVQQQQQQQTTQQQNNHQRTFNKYLNK